jgi:guanosine-3',5'-bis(diphosphate) 3'-pyrophosphohydrolase
MNPKQFVYDDKDMNRVLYFAMIESLVPPSRVSVIREAYQFAKYGHKDQKRDDGGRYFNHPRALSVIALTEFKISDWQVHVLCLIHDLKEDSYLVTYEVIEKLFGSEVALAFRRVTKDPKEGYMERMEMFGQVLDWLVKCIDRLHNMRTLGNCVPAKIQKQVIETRDHYVPLARRLVTILPEADKWRGLYLASELERLCREHEQKLTVNSTAVVEVT